MIQYVNLDRVYLTYETMHCLWDRVRSKFT